MANPDLVSFTQAYIDVALKAAQDTPYMSDFYDHIFIGVSKKTGLLLEEVKYLHHPFHWSLFLEPGHPLEIVDLPRGNGDSKVGVKSHVEPSDLVSRVLERHGAMLEERMEKITKRKKANTPAQ